MRCVYLLALSIAAPAAADTLLVEESDAGTMTIIEDNTPAGSQIAPLAESQMPRGALRIVVFPPESEVFINGVRIGIGNQSVDNLKPGHYNVYVAHGDKSETETVKISVGEVEEVSISLERKTRFCVGMSFSTIWAETIPANGQSLDFGIQVLKKHYFGLNYHWDVFRDIYYDYDNEPAKNGSCLGGGAIQYYYEGLNYRDVLMFSPGACIGFWYFWGHKRIGYDPYYGYDYYDYIDRPFFWGLSSRFSVGYKYVFLNTAYTLLISPAPDIGHALIVGILGRI